MNHSAKRTTIPSKQPLPVWCGLGLGHWLRLLSLGPPMSWRRAGRLALVSASCVPNSLLGLAERLLYGRRVQSLELSPPIFILGHWRSGTTLLHELLSRDPQFTFPTQYECAFPGHFLLTGGWLPWLTRWLVPKTRPMDNMAAGWDRPGEDEIALLLLTLHSPYLRVAFPDSPGWLNRLNSLERGLTAKQFEAWQRAFVGFLKKVAFRRGRPVLLKSPSHTGRIRLLRNLFPGAKFIHIARNPFEVYSSTMHLHRVLCRDNAFTTDPPRDLQEYVLGTYLDMYQAYHTQKALVPESHRYDLRYEELTADPVGQLQRIYAHFGFSGGDAIAERLAPELESLLAYRRNEYRLSDEERQLVADRWGVAFRRYGYSDDPAQVVTGITPEARE